MKIRTCFVSNSSSSSSVTSECYMGVRRSYSGDDGLSGIRNLPGDLRLAGDCREYIGIPVIYMREDETVAQFRRRAYELLLSVGFTGKESDVDWQLPIKEVVGD